MDSAWEEYRRRLWAFRLAIVLSPLWIFPGALIRYFLVACGVDGDWASLLAVGLPPMVTIMVAHLRRMFWPCPRCGLPFNAGWSDRWWWWSRSCTHCGLPLWAPRPVQSDLPASTC